MRAVLESLRAEDLTREVKIGGPGERHAVQTGSVLAGRVAPTATTAQLAAIAAALKPIPANP